MKFDGLERSVKTGLSDELRELAEEFLRDECIKFLNMEKQFKKAEKIYEKILDTGVTEEYLSKNGYKIKLSKRAGDF